MKTYDLYFLRYSNLPSISEALPIVKLTGHDMDKKVFGVICDKEDSKQRQFEDGNFVSILSKTNTFFAIDLMI